MTARTARDLELGLVFDGRVGGDPRLDSWYRTCRVLVSLHDPSKVHDLDVVVDEVVREVYTIGPHLPLLSILTESES